MTPVQKPGGPDFSQPIAALKHCHDRIRRELQALDALQVQLATHGRDAAARTQAAAIVRYFETAAPIHHADEEEDLIPMLQTLATDADAALLQMLAPSLLKEHREMASTWTNLMAKLQDITGSANASAPAPEPDLIRLIKQFSLLYAAHMDTEETHIATMARRLFSAQELARLGNGMLARRGLPPLNGVSHPTGKGA